MNFKHTGPAEVQPILFAVEKRIFSKAIKHLELIAKIPCAQKERAKEAAKALKEIVDELTKQDTEEAEDEPVENVDSETVEPNH